MVAAFVFTLAACGRADDTKDTQTEERQESSQTATEPTEGSINDEPAETTDIASEGGDTAQSGSKILIAYFTAAENSGVDAVSSASYTTVGGTAVGRLRAVADMIQENTDGDLFSIQICKGKKLWMNSYSSPLYGQMESVETSISDHFIWEAGNGAFCFVESDKLKCFEERMEALIVLRWDRKYPADVYLDLDLHS